MTDTLAKLNAQEADLWERIQTAHVTVADREADVDKANADLAALQVELSDVQDAVRGAS